MPTFSIFMGTVGLALLALFAVAYMLREAWRALRDERDEIAQPVDVAERLGALTHGQVFTDTCQKRAESKRRLTLVASKTRGPAKLSAFAPKGVR